VNDGHHTNSQGVRSLGYVARPAGPWRNENVLSDPIGADVGPLPSIDAERGDTADKDGKDGAIDGLPGRYERRTEEVDEVWLDLAQAPLGATNG
jgi:hypothetical protein